MSTLSWSWYEILRYVSDAIENYYTIYHEDGSYTIFPDKEDRIERIVDELGFWDRILDFKERYYNDEEVPVEEIKKLKEDFDEMYRSL